MNPITDDDLVLYRYRDGLDAARIQEIEAALAESPALRDRYAAIERAIANFDTKDIEPDPDFGSRLWRQLAPELKKSGVIASPGPRTVDRLREWLAPPRTGFAFALAATVLIAVAVGFIVGRESVTVTVPPRVVASNQVEEAAAARVLEAYVAANLRATEGVLLTASNSGDASLLEGNRELAQSLVESNRLYALAATRAGNTQLATFLRQLEPVLLSLANQPGTATLQSSEDLRHFLDSTDLLFQVRTIEARLDRTGKRRADHDGDSRI
ncbi:MAG TPA: hypothetical protein VH814_17180 [Steroidobacteraceae bacterium]|jgi:hypothetical protein